MVDVGDALLGRVLDGLGRPIDGRPAPQTWESRPLHAAPPSPLARAPIDTALPTGVRAVDAMLTLGKGQRIGIFAGGGVGKSTLLGMMVKNAAVDVAVVALCGERGREVEEFVRNTLGDKGLARSVVVAATSADAPLVRARVALQATAIAEHFRDAGKNVLLVMDSLTRYAMALREIGLATGEPPTTKGYTPSVFAALPRLLERAGTSTGKGSITGLYTVLVEGDDLSDPIADAARAILDGHIVLRRAIAERGMFPAIDVPASISRVMSFVASPERRKSAQRARALLAAHREAEDLVAIGAYKAGASARLDEAIARMPKLEAFLAQDADAPAAKDIDAALAAIWRDR
jgi:flagellum-specific ATP synthase